MCALEYAQARVQSRHGERAPAQAWASLHASMTLAALLEQARASALESWTAGLDAGCAPADVEALLRERLRGRITEVARWMPGPWRAAVLWTRVLLDLPALQHLAFGHAPAPWMARDAALAARIAEAPDEDRARRMRRAWLESWRRQWPRCGADERHAMEELVRAFEAHVAAFERAAPDDAWNLRRALEARIEILFRRHALLAAAAFDHLALLALDVERLRAELMARIAARIRAAQ